MATWGIYCKCWIFQISTYGNSTKSQHMNHFPPGEQNGDSPSVINSNSWKSHFLSVGKNGCPLLGHGLGQAGQAASASLFLTGTMSPCREMFAHGTGGLSCLTGVGVQPISVGPPSTLKNPSGELPLPGCWGLGAPGPHGPSGVPEGARSSTA